MRFPLNMAALAFAGAMALEAQPRPGHGPGPGPGPKMSPTGGGFGRGGPRMEQHGAPGDWDRPRSDRDRPPLQKRNGPEGRWWTDLALVQRLGLSPDQQRRIDDVFQQNRPRLMELSSALQREESYLEPLLEADHPDESRVVTQIDRIAQARGDLEKANARMLLGFREVLNQDQWKRLQSDSSSGAPPRGSQAVLPGRDR